MRPEDDLLVLEGGQGERVNLGGLGVIFKLSGDDTGGAFSIVEHPIAAGTLANPHVHANEDEFSIVLEGVIGAKVGNREVTLGEGAYIAKPRGIPHAFWNPGPAPARMIEIISPAGFERYFDDLANLFATSSGPPVADQIERLRERYALTAVPGWSSDLIQRHHLHLGGSGTRSRT
jgi:mannose-6-phosphate isomerase-like protein (cupin superfamily)